MSKFQKFLTGLVVLLLAFGAFGAAFTPRAAAAPKVHPQLVALAAEKPEQPVAVIAQKADDTTGAEQLVARLGGQVTKDLHIINAFAARLPARGAVQLAQSPLVRWVSPDGPVARSGKPGPAPAPITSNTYLDTLRARQVWSMGITGSGIGVAVIDSGVSPTNDLMIAKSASFNPNSTSTTDVYGHGTHVAGIIAGDGDLSNKKFQGVAPGAKIISMKVSDETGMAYESDVVAAMQWVYDNKTGYNIRVVNISLNSTVEQSYHLSPMSAAAEILWFNGVVVVVSAGNKGDGSYNTANASPANDPFLITVGAADEMATSNPGDDAIATYTAWTITADNYIKPDMFAPGSNIISVLSGHSDWDAIAPERVVDGNYFRLSGTSMAAPMVAGAAALLLQDEPNLTPDQVKYRLLNASGRTVGIKVGKTTYSFPYLDVYAVVTGTTTQSANTNFQASQLLWSGSEPVVWGSVAWNSVAWNSVAWNSVAWNSVAWNSVAWNSVAWNE